MEFEKLEIYVIGKEIYSNAISNENNTLELPQKTSFRQLLKLY